MPLKLGAYTACLHDRPLAEALDVLQADGLTSVEVNTGGFIPPPHSTVDLLLSPAPSTCGPPPRRPAGTTWRRSPPAEWSSPASTATATRSTRCPASARS